MKATLEFNLPEEQTEFEEASHGSKLVGVLFEVLYNELRGMIKYEDPKNPFTAAEAEKFRNYLWKHLDEAGLIYLLDS